MNEDDIIIGEFSPEWMDDGLGLSGEQIDTDVDEAGRQWDTTCWSQQNQQSEDFGACQ